MAEERRKDIVAAILAVHSGIVSPDDAVAALSEPGRASTLESLSDAGNATVKMTDEQGEPVELPILDVLDDPAKQARALSELGVDEEAQQTLFNFGETGGDDEAGMGVIADTLRRVAGDRRREAGGERPGTTPMPKGSESPTMAPADESGPMRLTTSKFYASFGTGDERYEVKKEHARGGMGRILIAKDKSIGREIALKELLPGITGTSSVPGSVPQTTGSHGIIERFLREAKITGQLEHPNIVPVYEIGKHDDNSIYYTMRFVRGQTLNDRLRDIRKDTTLSREEKLTARIKLLDPFIDVCNAIAYAHNKGVIHRDIKPENIMLGEFGETQVLDWGLARIKGQEDKALKELRKGSMALSKSLYQSDTDALTLDGSIVGTPAYMPPEQARGELESVDERSDVYALGAVLYQILTGHAPYEGPMAALIVQQVLNSAPIRVRSREKDVPPELEALVERAMAREKEDRLQSALELASEVKAFRDGRTLGSYSYSLHEIVGRFVKQHRTTVSVGVLGFLLLVAGTIFFMQQLTRERDEAMFAKSEAESRRKLAENALEFAATERAERLRLEQERREQAQAEFNARVEEARKLLATTSGIRIDPAVDDLRGRLAHYRAMLDGRGFLELPVDEQTGVNALLSGLLGYISSKQALFDLLDVPEGVELPEDLAAIDLPSERNELAELRLDASSLAAINGEFPLALLLLSGDVPPEQVSAARERIENARAELLDLQRRRINEALADVDLGLDREGRGDDAPTLEDYVQRLSTYREPQTVQILRAELNRLVEREASGWTRNQLNVAVLCCRVLGNVDQPSEAIPVLVRFVQWAERPELIDEAGLALCATGSMDAFEPVIAEFERRGRDYEKKLMDAFARVPMPARVREPETARDYVDRSIALRARGLYYDAEVSASRALSFDEQSVPALMQRALANHARGMAGDAIHDLDRAIEIAEDPFELLLARGDMRDPVRDHEDAVADYTAAIELRPDNWRGYFHRAGALAAYYRYDESFEDYEKALELEPGRIGIYLEYGRAAQQTGLSGTQRALAQFTRAIEKWPQDWRGWSARAVLKREHGAGSPDDDARTAVRLNPDDSASWSVITQVEYAFSRFHEGIQAATRAVEANPQEWLAFYYRGLHYSQMQKNTDGQQFASMTGEGQAPIQNFGELRTSNLEAAADSFRAALRVEPTDFRTSLLLMDTLMQLRRYQEAREVCADALEISPFCYMRWGGIPAPEVRYTHDALLHLDLLNRAPDGFRQSAHKVVLLSALATSDEHNIFPRENEPRLREAVRLMDECWSHVQAEPTPENVVLFSYAQDRLIPALMYGHGRHGYVEALRECERRLEIGRYLDEGFYFNLMKAHLGLARGYRNNDHGLLGTGDAARKSGKEAVRAMGEDERARLAADHMQAAGEAFEKAVERGFSQWPWLWGRSVLGDIREWERFEEVNEKMQQPATIEPESLYDSPLLVVHILEGGPAWRAGARKFDNIVAVNDHAVSNAGEFFEAWSRIEEGADATLTVRRYLAEDGRLQLVRDEDGEVIRDEAGFAQWRYDEVVLELKRGFLGINLGEGFLPPRFER